MGCRQSRSISCWIDLLVQTLLDERGSTLNCKAVVIQHTWMDFAHCSACLLNEDILIDLGVLPVDWFWYANYFSTIASTSQNKMMKASVNTRSENPKQTGCATIPIAGHSLFSMLVCVTLLFARSLASCLIDLRDLDEQDGRRFGRMKLWQLTLLRSMPRRARLLSHQEMSTPLKHLLLSRGVVLSLWPTSHSLQKVSHPKTTWPIKLFFLSASLSLTKLAFFANTPKQRDL